MITTSAYEVASRYIGTTEIKGQLDNPNILAWLKMDGDWPEHDEVPWCSAFANYVAKTLGLPRSKSLRARSWLAVGRPIELSEARPEEDIIILARGSGPQPGPEVLNAPGHVGFYVDHGPDWIQVLGGNQADTVKISRYGAGRLLGVRRLVD